MRHIFLLGGIKKTIPVPEEEEEKVLSYMNRRQDVAINHIQAHYRRVEEFNPGAIMEEQEIKNINPMDDVTAQIKMSESPSDDPNMIKARSELGNEVNIPLTNPDISEEEGKMIQDSISKYGDCFATCPPRNEKSQRL